MRQFQTTILERKTNVTNGFATEPIEAAWAAEAIFFLQLFESEVDFADMQASVQISPDGIRWVDEGAMIATDEQTGLHFVRANHFGGWLRLHFNLNPADSHAIATIHAALKE